MNRITKIAKSIIATLNAPDADPSDVSVLVDEMMEVFDDNVHNFMRISPKVSGQLCEAIKQCAVYDEIDAIDIIDSASDILSIVDQFGR